MSVLRSSYFLICNFLYHFCVYIFWICILHIKLDWTKIHIGNCHHSNNKQKHKKASINRCLTFHGFASPSIVFLNVSHAKNASLAVPDCTIFLFIHTKARNQHEFFQVQGSKTAQFLYKAFLSFQQIMLLQSIRCTMKTKKKEYVCIAIQCVRLVKVHSQNTKLSQ